MALDARRRSAIYDRLAPLIGEENANALMSEFPSVEADELVTNQFLRAELAITRGELRSEIGALRDELRSELGVVRDELRSELGVVRDELRSELGVVRDELRSQLGLVRVDLAALENRLTLRLGGGLGVVAALLATLITLQ